MDPLSPAPPRPAYFDSVAGAWMLSRYADVRAALREPALRQESGECSTAPNARSEIFGALSPTRLAHWQQTIEPAARAIIDALPTDRPVDLLREVIRPWTAEVAILILRDGSERRQRLLRLAHDRSESTGLRRKLANIEFEYFFRGRPSEKSAFIGASETLPAFLANAWVALLRHPCQMARLRKQPDSMPQAVEELLRYAGLVHSLAREAASNVDLAGVRIARGDRVILKLASANRDPGQFTDPDRLDLGRRLSSQLALGQGEHACAGAVLVRAAFSTLTRALMETFSDLKLNGGIEWRWGEMLVSPARLPVRLISH
jgi:cytochrome P450